jgi:hypothetical protein
MVCGSPRDGGVLSFLDGGAASIVLMMQSCPGSRKRNAFASSSRAFLRAKAFCFTKRPYGGRISQDVKHHDGVRVECDRSPAADRPQRSDGQLRVRVSYGSQGGAERDQKSGQSEQ